MPKRKYKFTDDLQKKKSHVYVVAVTNSTSRDISVSC